MKKNLYCLYDVKSEFYGVPVLFHNDEDAKRGYSGIFQNPTSQSAKYPEDFRLFLLGVFNDSTGEIVCPETPAFLTELSSLNHHPEKIEGDI